MPLRLQIVNLSARSVGVYSPSTLEGYEMVVIDVATGVQLPLKAPRDGSEGGNSAGTQIYPGHVEVVTLDMSRFVAIASAGTFRVQVRAVRLYRPDIRAYVNATSNPVILKITP